MSREGRTMSREGRTMSRSGSPAVSPVGSVRVSLSPQESSALCQRAPQAAQLKESPQESSPLCEKAPEAAQLKKGMKRRHSFTAERLACALCGEIGQFETDANTDELVCTYCGVVVEPDHIHHQPFKLPMPACKRTSPGYGTVLPLQAQGGEPGGTVDPLIQLQRAASSFVYSAGQPENSPGECVRQTLSERRDHGSGLSRDGAPSGDTGVQNGA